MNQLGKTVGSLGQVVAEGVLFGVAASRQAPGTGQRDTQVVGFVDVLEKHP